MGAALWEVSARLRPSLCFRAAVHCPTCVDSGLHDFHRRMRRLVMSGTFGMAPTSAHTVWLQIRLPFAQLSAKDARLLHRSTPNCSDLTFVKLS